MIFPERKPSLASRIIKRGILALTAISVALASYGYGYLRGKNEAPTGDNSRGEPDKIFPFIPEPEEKNQNTVIPEDVTFGSLFVSAFTDLDEDENWDSGEPPIVGLHLDITYTDKDGVEHKLDNALVTNESGVASLDVNPNTSKDIEISPFFEDEPENRNQCYLADAKSIGPYDEATNSFPTLMIIFRAVSCLDTIEA